MGIAGRKRKHGEKMAKKRAAKAAKRDKYQKLAGTSKRAKRSNGRKMRSNLKHAHAMANCGNPGCQKCFPRPRRKIFVKPIPTVEPVAA